MQAVNKVDIIARVTAFVAERNFTEGDEVAKGALLYTLERGPFEADLAGQAGRPCSSRPPCCATPR